MTNDDKQAAMPFSPQESVPELEEQVLEKITGAEDNAFGNKWTETSKPYLGRSGQFSPNPARVQAGPVSEVKKDIIKTFDSQQINKLKPLKILKK